MAVAPFQVSVTCEHCSEKRSYMSNVSDPGCPRCNREAKCRELEENIECDKAIEIGEEILEAVNELPAKAQEFGEGVAERTRSIMETIQAKNRVSESQMNALKNMRSGVFRWLK